MVDQVAYRVGLAAIPRRRAECPVRDCQINDNEAATPANDRMLQASESFPARRGLLRRLGSMILHRTPLTPTRPRSLPLSVLPRNPKDVSGAIIVHCATGDKEKVRETVDVL